MVIEKEKNKVGRVHFYIVKFIYNIILMCAKQVIKNEYDTKKSWKIHPNY